MIGDALRNAGFKASTDVADDGYLYMQVEFGCGVPSTRRQHASGSGVHISFNNEPSVEEETSRFLNEASLRAKGELDEAGYEHVHAYCWPGDGNFYRYVRVKPLEGEDPDQTRERVKRDLQKLKASVRKVFPLEPKDEVRVLFIQDDAERGEALKRLHGL